MKDRPRVLYLCGWQIGSRGQGAVSFVYEQIEALSERVDAVFVEPHFSSVWEWPGRRSRGERIGSIDDLWPAGVTALNVWTPRLSTRLTRRTQLEDVWRSGTGIARQLVNRVGRVDLIHAHVVLPAGWLGASISEATGVPLILQEHSGPFDMHLDTAEKRAAVRRTLSRAEAVIAVGSRLAEKMAPLTSPPDKIRVIPNLVRTDFFSVAPRRPVGSPLRLVTVASLHPIKGLDYLVDAVGLLRLEGHAARLDIIGEGPERERLTARISDAGLEGSIALRGSLPRAAVAEAITAADVYVCSSRAETFGIAPAEALSVGRPVVTTCCGGPEQFVDESCGTVVPPGDSAALAKGVLDVSRRLHEFDAHALHYRMDRLFGRTAFVERMLRLYSGTSAGDGAATVQAAT